MIIEGAEKFGLAQLHQLRGEWGRGAIQSYCYLFSDTQDESTVNGFLFCIPYKRAELANRPAQPGPAYFRYEPARDINRKWLL
jgi:hypothetical protein